jgi:hypothetical protein
MYVWNVALQISGSTGRVNGWREKRRGRFETKFDTTEIVDGLVLKGMSQPPYVCSQHLRPDLSSTVLPNARSSQAIVNSTT